MKQTPTFPRRTALAIAAASAGLTLAVTATIASSLGLIAPSAPVAAPRTSQEQPIQQPPVTIMSDTVASSPTDSVDQSTTSTMLLPSARTDESRPARREHDDDDDHDKKLRRSPTNGEAAARSAGQFVSRTRHAEDDDD